MAILSLTSKMQGGKNLTSYIIQYLIAKEKFPNLKFGTDSFYYPGHAGHAETDIEIQSGWKQKAFAYKLKQIASILLGVPIENFEDNNFKDSLLGPEWESYGYANGFNHEYRDGKEMETVMNVAFCDKERYEIERRVNWQTAYHSKMTVREFLQKLGSEAIRNSLHINTWINAFFADYKALDDTKRVSMGNVLDYSECPFPNWIITDTRFPNEFTAIKNRKGICIKIVRPIELRLPALWRNYVSKNTIISSDEDSFMNWLKEYNLDAWKKYNHSSETAWENENFDYVLLNDCNLDEYIFRVRVMLQHFKIINE
jgi:hypothetical protein